MRRALLLGAGAVGLAVVAALAASGAEGATVSATGGPFDSLYQQYGAQFGVDWHLLKAIAQHESSENPSAVNSLDNESIGLGQVYCKPDGRGGCANELNVDGWAGITRASLLVPEMNVYIFAQILAANIRAYGVPKGIAVYNAWDQHTAPESGPFKNQSYVDDVLRRASALGFQP